MTMRSDDVDDDGYSDENNANDKDGGNDNNDDGEVEHVSGDDNDNGNDDDGINIDIIEDDIDEWMTTMRWR